MPRPAVAPDPLWRAQVRDFVPVGEVVGPPSPAARATPLDVPLPAIDPPDAWETRVSLFGDLER